jgi:hypothetical protein
MSSKVDYTSDRELRELYTGLSNESLINLLIEKFRLVESLTKK